VLLWLTLALSGLSVLLLLAAGWYAARDRLIDDVLLGASAVLVVGLVVQLVRGLTVMGAITDASERATFVAYLVTLPFVPVATAFLAIKEKSRWSMGALAVGAFGVFVMVVRIQQIWELHV